MNYLNKKRNKKNKKAPLPSGPLSQLQLALVSSSSSTFLYSVQKRLYNEAMQSKLGQSLTKHQGVNTFGKNLPQEINNSLMNYLNNHLRKKTFGKTQPQEKTLKKQKIQIANNVLKRQKIQNTKVSHFGKIIPQGNAKNAKI